jgi:single-strand DNA-binding protein
MGELRMPDINSVIIVGNLIKDPIFRHTTTGTPVTNFYIASNRKFKDNVGNWKEDVCFVGVVAWYKLAESCFENLRKGSAVLVEGELQSRTFRTDDGFNRNVVEIKARRIQFLNRREFSGNNDFYSEAEKPSRMNYDQTSSSESDSRDDVDNSDVKTQNASQKEYTEDSRQEDKKEEERHSYDEQESESDFDFGYKDLKL